MPCKLPVESCKPTCQPQKIIKHPANTAASPSYEVLPLNKSQECNGSVLMCQTEAWRITNLSSSVPDRVPECVQQTDKGTFFSLGPTWNSSTFMLTAKLASFSKTCGNMSWLVLASGTCLRMVRNKTTAVTNDRGWTLISACRRVLRPSFFDQCLQVHNTEGSPQILTIFWRICCENLQNLIQIISSSKPQGINKTSDGSKRSDFYL